MDSVGFAEFIYWVSVKKHLTKEHYRNRPTFERILKIQIFFREIAQVASS